MHIDNGFDDLSVSDRKKHFTALLKQQKQTIWTPLSISTYFSLKYQSTWTIGIYASWMTYFLGRPECRANAPTYIRNLNFSMCISIIKHLPNPCYYVGIFASWYPLFITNVAFSAIFVPTTLNLSFAIYMNPFPHFVLYVLQITRLHLFNFSVKYFSKYLLARYLTHSLFFWCILYLKGLLVFS